MIESVPSQQTSSCSSAAASPVKAACPTASATAAPATPLQSRVRNLDASAINNSVIVLCLEGCHGVGKTYVCDHFRKYMQSEEDSQITFLDEAFMSAASPTKKKSSPSSAPTTPEKSSSSTAQSQSAEASPSASSPLTLHRSPEKQAPASPQQPPALPQLMHPQSAFCELNWLNNWFQRIMLLKQQHMVEQQKLLARIKEGDMSPPQALEAAVARLSRPKLFVVDRSPYSCYFYTRNSRGKSFIHLIKSLIEELEKDADVHIKTLCLKVSNADTLWSRISDRLKREPIRLQFNENSRDWMNHVYTMYEEFKHWDLEMVNDGVFEGKRVEEMLFQLEQSVMQQMGQTELPL